MTRNRQGQSVRATLGSWRVVLTALLVMGVLWSALSPAAADVPSEPVGAFTAPACEGTTLLNPTDAAGPVPDLRSVFGARLTQYNEGNVVPLYDSFAQNSTNGYPPVCSTRFVDGVGAVSEWMFCTDYFDHVCSGVDADGNLLDIDGSPIPGLEQLTGANPKLTATQERVIAYLIQHGQSTYQGTGYFNFNDTARAVSNGDSWERSALQVLIWCVTDPVPPGAAGIELERAITCEDNMGPERQASILASAPAEPSLSITGPATASLVDESAEFVITTNIFSSPLTIETSGVSGALSVVSGPATLVGDQLQVSGADSPATVTLGFTPTAPGTVTLSGTAAPSSTAGITWNQSPGRSADGVPCQVFATFRAANQVVLNTSASARLVEGFGDFAIAKFVEWSGQPIDGIVFTGTYTVTAPDGSVTVEDAPFSVAEGGVWTSEEYEAGSTVHLEEILPTEPANISWAAPEFSSNDFVLGDETTVDVVLTNAASVEVGMFEASKALAGDGVSLVPDDAVFLLDYSYPAGDGFAAGAGTLELPANGDAVTSGELPIGAVLSLAERAPDAITGATWAQPDLSSDTITIVIDETASVTVTNTLTLDTGAAEGGSDASAEGAESGSGSGAASGLALTGGELPALSLFLGFTLAVVGGSILAYRRARPRQ